jgi:hypothetical protein
MNSPKYNRTFHLPWSKGATSDDKIAHDISALLNVPIVITEKLDGSNVSLEAEGCYARTHASAPTHASFNGLKALHASIKHLIPPEVQIFGEWLWARHSIDYDKLPGYFLAFNVRLLDTNMWEPWEMVKEWAKEIGVHTVPLLFQGIIKSETELRDITESLVSQPSAYGPTREGVVIRVAGGFEDKYFSKYVAKWVRANHVQTSEHWKNQQIVKNKLAQ